jgi:hypothetical protein
MTIIINIKYKIKIHMTIKIQNNKIIVNSILKI